jgi:hypothetical protein
VSGPGDVDPLRVPAPIVGVVERFRTLPTVAQAFIALAVLDAVARTIGVIEPTVGGTLIGLIHSYVPRDAWIVLPALLLVRRPTAPADTPWVYRGALLVALATLLVEPTVSIVGSAIPAESIEPHVALSVIEPVLLSIGFLLVGRGLVALNPSAPRPEVAGLANLAATAILGSVVVEVVASVASTGTADVAFTAPWWSYATAIGTSACIAYLLRSVTRGLGDPARSEAATRVAAAGAATWAIGRLIEGLAYGVATLDHSLRLFGGESLSAFAVVALLQIAGPLLVVVGLGLGLADPLRPMAGAWAAALRADPRGAAPPA